jgi:uncharacterized protein
MSPAVQKLQWLQEHLGAVVAALFVCVVIAVGLVIFNRQSNAETLHAGSHNFSLEVADTSQARTLGLSNRASLAADHGMLFVFPGAPKPQCFWMRDMSFPLDIIWAGANKQVVHIEQNVNPDTYPQSFCPSEPAQYVIELNAGTAASAGIRVGQTLNF